MFEESQILEYVSAELERENGGGECGVEGQFGGGVRPDSVSKGGIEPEEDESEFFFYKSSWAHQPLILYICLWATSTISSSIRKRGENGGTADVIVR